MQTGGKMQIQLLAVISGVSLAVVEREKKCFFLLPPGGCWGARTGRGICGNLREMKITEIVINTLAN